MPLHDHQTTTLKALGMNEAAIRDWLVLAWVYSHVITPDYRLGPIGPVKGLGLDFLGLGRGRRAWRSGCRTDLFFGSVN
jgi:hypothetical protein